MQKPLDVTEPSVQFEERWLNMLTVLLEASTIFFSNVQEGGVASAEAPGDTRLARVNEVFEQEKQDALANNQTEPDPRSFLSKYQGGLVLNSGGVVPLDKYPILTNASGLEAAVESLFGGTLTTLALTLMLPAAYGGVHLAAWSWTFPTAVERLLWRVSSLMIAGMTPAVIAVFANSIFLSFAVRNTASYIRRIRDRNTNGNARRESVPWDSQLPGPVAAILMASMVVLVVSCMFARLYIVVESFIGLRLVPIGAYLTPFWLEMIPHV